MVGWPTELTTTWSDLRSAPVLLIGAEILPGKISVKGGARAADVLNANGRWENLPLWDLLAEIGGFAAGALWWDEGFAAQTAARAADARLLLPCGASTR
jgi:hypothetical protein